MKIVNVPRMTGKTTRLLEYANDNNSAIIVSTVAKKNKLIDIALHEGYRNVSIYTVHELIHGLNGAKFSPDDKICIDDMEEVLEEMIGFNIDVATCSIPMKNIEESFPNEQP